MSGSAYGSMPGALIDIGTTVMPAASTWATSTNPPRTVPRRRPIRVARAPTAHSRPTKWSGKKIVEKPIFIERKVVVEKPVVVDRPVYIEKEVIVEKPVYREVERIVEKPVEKIIEVIVEKPVIVHKYVEKEVQRVVDLGPLGQAGLLVRLEAGQRAGGRVARAAARRALALDGVGVDVLPGRRVEDRTPRGRREQGGRTQVELRPTDAHEPVDVVCVKLRLCAKPNNTGRDNERIEPSERFLGRGDGNSATRSSLNATQSAAIRIATIPIHRG